MPRIDSVTGCTVMTLPDFYAKEAEQEGKGRTGGDIMEDFQGELDADCRHEEEKLRTPEVAWESVSRAWNDYIDSLGEEEETQVSAPKKLLEVLEVHINPTSKMTTTTIRARCLCKDGSERVFKVERWDTVATRLDPSDSGDDLTWE